MWKPLMRLPVCGLVWLTSESALVHGVEVGGNLRNQTIMLKTYFNNRVAI